MEALAWGILRASAMSIENVNSAVEIVLPLGVFITTMPRWVAASTSTLSTPTPARPTTRKLGAASMTLRVVGRAGVGDHRLRVRDEGNQFRLGEAFIEHGYLELRLLLEILDALG